MRANTLLVVALAICSACKKDTGKAPPSPSAPTSTKDQDELWALAPDKAIGGLVITPAALARLEAGAREVDKVFATAPDLAVFKAKIENALEDVLGTKTFSLAAAGLTAQKGLAAFAVEGGEKPVVILPVGDRDKFLAVMKGTKGADTDTIKSATCKTVKGVYACARDATLLDRLGKGSLADTLKLVGARGDIEVAGMIPGSPVQFAGVAQLGRGSFIVRGAVKGIPDEAKKFLANVKPRLDGDKTAGFAVLSFGSAIAPFKDKVPPMPVVPGVTADMLVKSLEGPLTMTIDNGAAMFDVRLPLNDGAAMQKLVEQCDKIPPAQQMGATVKDGVCHAAIPQMQMELDAWVDGKTLRIGKKGGTSGVAGAAMSPIAQELANGEWAFAMFGRGTMYGPAHMKLPVPTNLPEEAALGLRAFAVLNELGFGVRIDGDVVRGIATVRTMWSNPDDVVAKLVAIDPQDVFAGKAAEKGKAIADASPQSPFATDYKTGTSGLMMPAAMVGVLAAVAVPAFMDYMKKSKKSEAALQLNKLGKNLKVAYVTNSEFPKGTVGPSPAKSCCGGPGNRCDDQSAWADPVWQSLDFMVSEPHQYRYSYSSTDGKTFEAKAIGDLDCDGKEAEYVMTGKVDDTGNPVIEIAEPQPGSY